MLTVAACDPYSFGTGARGSWKPPVEKLDWMYDSEAIARIAAEIGEKVDCAVLGQIPWDEVPRAIVQAFPGSMASLQSLSTQHDHLNFIYSDNLDPDYLRTYAEHYAFINPWSHHWDGVPGGTVALSEQEYPAHLLKGTEFYHDWLKPQKNMEAAAGLKVSGAGDGLIFLPVHYGLAQSAGYDEPVTRVLRHLRGNLARAMHLSTHMSTGLERATASAAIIERQDCAAIVVDASLRLRDANDLAERLLTAGDPLRVRQGRVGLAQKRATLRFAEIVSALARSLPIDTSPLVVRSDNETYLLSFAAIPVGASGLSGLLTEPQPQVLVMVRKPEATPSVIPPARILTEVFRLTPAEIRLCNELAVGASLSEAAASLGISVETARVRCKTVFQKTRTHRQIELVTLLRSLR